MRVYTAFEPLPEPDAVLDLLEAWFGMPRAAFAGHRFWHRPGSKAIWIAAAEATPPPSTFKVEAFGMLVSRQKGGFKPTSVFLQRFGHLAEGRRITLAEAQLEPFLRREPIDLDAPLEPGYAIVSDPGGTVLGCGRVHQDGRLRSELPKSWTMVWRPTAG